MSCGSCGWPKICDPKLGALNSSWFPTKSTVVKNISIELSKVLQRAKWLTTKMAKISQTDRIFGNAAAHLHMATAAHVDVWYRWANSCWSKPFDGVFQGMFWPFNTHTDVICAFEKRCNGFGVVHESGATLCGVVGLVEKQRNFALLGHHMKATFATFCLEYSWAEGTKMWVRLQPFRSQVFGHVELKMLLLSATFPPSEEVLFGKTYF